MSGSGKGAPEAANRATAQEKAYDFPDDSDRDRRRGRAGDRDSGPRVQCSPPTRWAYPQTWQYRVQYPPFVRAFAALAVAHQSADALACYAGVAVWLPPAVTPAEEALIALLQRTMAAAVLPDVLAILEPLRHDYPREPYGCLPLLAVDPCHQNQEYGSALLQHGLRRCDRDHTLASLEASSPRRLPLYERHGFEVMGTVQVSTSPPIFPRCRRPH